MDYVALQGGALVPHRRPLLHLTSAARAAIFAITLCAAAGLAWSRHPLQLFPCENAVLSASGPTGGGGSFIPLDGVDSVRVRPAPSGPLMLLPLPMLLKEKEKKTKTTSCFFAYTTLDRLHVAKAKAAGEVVRDDIAVLYGAKLPPQSQRKASSLAVASGRADDTVRGRLVCYGRADAFAAALAGLDRRYGLNVTDVTAAGPNEAVETDVSREVRA
eukprot:g68001.t1